MEPGGKQTLLLDVSGRWQQVREEAVGIAQQEAGELIHGSRRAWQDYESGARKMHPGLWELFQAKAQACRAGRQEDSAA